MKAPVRISFDAADLNDCERVVRSLQMLLEGCHGAAVARKLFATHTKSKRETRDDINLRLATDQMRSGLSVKKFAKRFAEKNKTNAEAIERQIGRTKKELKGDGSYFELERLFSKLAGKDNS